MGPVKGGQAVEVNKHLAIVTGALWAACVNV